MNKKRIIVDFDGTICGFAFPNCGLPERGVKKALIELSEMGFEIVIHSCRTSTYWYDEVDSDKRTHHIAVIVRYMDEYDLYYDEILIAENYDKPIASFYIDDRGVGYKDNWPDVVNEIRTRKDN